MSSLTIGKAYFLKSFTVRILPWVFYGIPLLLGSFRQYYSSYLQTQYWRKLPNDGIPWFTFFVPQQTGTFGVVCQAGLMMGGIYHARDRGLEPHHTLSSKCQTSKKNIYGVVSLSRVCNEVWLQKLNCNCFKFSLPLWANVKEN